MKTRTPSLLLLVLLLTPVVAAQEAAPPAEAPPPPPPVVIPDKPQQVNVAVKIVEFQTVRTVETGLSAYFARNIKERLYGRVSSGDGNIRTADLTFPTSTGTRMEGITVFLDNIHLSDGDMEIVLQALVDENRASIISRPRAMVVVGGEGTAIQTVRDIPYESPKVVGSTIVQSTQYIPTGVMLNIQCMDVIDDDGNWSTLEDQYAHLKVSAEVKELGTRVVVALDDRLAGGDAVTAPTFVTRSVVTTVWVRHGQVLVLGGLYRNNTSKTVESMPWLSQAEDLAIGVAERFIPGNFLSSPVSSVVGHKSSDDGRRELVFMIKPEMWRPAISVADEYDFGEIEEVETQPTLKESIGTMIDTMTTIPEDIGREISEQVIPPSEGIEEQLRGGRE